MKLQACIPVVYLASKTIASAYSSPYERVWLWYAYRLEIAANLQSTTRIAPDCPGKGPGGKCYFKEFIDYIGDNGNYVYPEILDDPKEMNPDVRNTADRLSTAGWTGSIKPSWVMPELGDEGSWGPMIKKVGAIVGNIRKVYFGNEEWMGTNTKALENCEDALTHAIAHRQCDISKILVERLSGRIPGINIQVDNVDDTGIPPRTLFNLERTYVAPENAAFRGELMQFLGTYLDTNSDAAGHQATVDNMNGAAAVQLCLE